MVRERIEDGDEPPCVTQPLQAGARLMQRAAMRERPAMFDITGMSVSAKGRFQAAMREQNQWAGFGGKLLRPDVLRTGAARVEPDNSKLVLGDGSTIKIDTPDPEHTGPGYTGEVPVFGEVGARQHGQKVDYILDTVQAELQKEGPGVSHGRMIEGLQKQLTKMYRDRLDAVARDAVATGTGSVRYFSVDSTKPSGTPFQRGEGSYGPEDAKRDMETKQKAAIMAKMLGRR